MSKQTKPELMRTGNVPLLCCDMTVNDKVESWNWNANIFEIYDEIRDWSPHDQKNVLKHAYYFFNKDKMINELHSFLVGWSVEET